MDDKAIGWWGDAYNYTLPNGPHSIPAITKGDPDGTVGSALAQVFEIPLAMKQARYQYYYYVDAGVKTINLTAQTLSGQVVRTGTIDVQRPDYLMNSSFGAVQITSRLNELGEWVPAVRFGSNAIQGFTLTSFPVGNNPGSHSFTQLIDSTITLASDATRAVKLEVVDDGSGILDQDNFSDPSESYWDSPWSLLEQNLDYLNPPAYIITNYLSRDDNFTTYLQWQSDKAQSIRVPIKRYSWFWMTEVTAPPGEGYRLEFQYHTSNGFIVGTDTTDHPEWTSHIEDYKFEYDQ